MNTREKHRLDRHKIRVEELKLWRNARESRIEEWRFAADDREAREIGLRDFWPEEALPASFSAEAKIPEDWAGSPVELELWLGGEGFVSLSTGFNGGLNPFHRSFPVTQEAVGGERVGIEAEVVPRGMFGSNVAEPQLRRSSLVVPETDVRALERDLGLIIEVCEQLGDHEVVPHLLDVVDAAFAGLFPLWPSASEVALTRYLEAYAESTDGGPWSLPPAPRDVEPLSEETRSAVREARAMVASGLKELKAEYPPVGRLALTGHAHLDLAWLWPVSETLRKGRRTFASVLSLMECYEDFVFNQSSAQLYHWIETGSPEIFERVKRRIEEGRWEPVGGSWVESDCQIPSGESMVRQMLYGQRYFEDKFGHRSRVAWLPDAFGFSPALPQLLRGAGMEGFFTYKLNWSETNEFPYDLYEWEGIDGSTVIAHDFENPGQDYNGNITPHDLYGTWSNFEGKRHHPESLFSFGWGDGGGGPSEQMLENYARLEEFPAMPRLRMARVDEYFASLPEEDLPRWVGELYLELHRGTLTTQSAVKRLNRAAEHRLLEAEAVWTLAALRSHRYPGDELERLWKLLLLNQFHDVLPGTSISEVYEDTHSQLGEVVASATDLREAALRSLDGEEDISAVTVANAGLHARSLTALLPAETSRVVTDAGGELLPTQLTPDGLLVHAPDSDVPGLGWTSLSLGEVTWTETASRVRAGGSDGGAYLENEILRVEIGADGSLRRVHDAEVGREVLDGRGNQLWVYADKPPNWDAWDVHSSYEAEGQEIRDVESVEVVERGPLRAAVRVTRRWLGSRITQTYRLLSGSRRLDVETHLDWHERQLLLRALFPLNVRSHEATFETMYGAVERPTHRNTSWDEVRFEVAAHRFCDLGEPGYGVALLNDGKYGHSARDNVLGMSLLRSPLYPDPFADEGEHRFTYSLFPHPDDWTGAGVAREAFALNSPLFVGRGRVEPIEYGLVAAEGVELALGSLKQAEEGGGVILRLYEPHGARGPASLRFAFDVRKVERVNLLEEPDGEIEARDNEFPLDVRPFEVLTLRVEPAG